MVRIGDLVGHKMDRDDPDPLSPHRTCGEIADMYGQSEPSVLAYGKVTEIKTDGVIICVEGGLLSKRQSHFIPTDRIRPM
jgi:hypothetical protein